MRMPKSGTKAAAAVAAALLMMGGLMGLGGAAVASSGIHHPPADKTTVLCGLDQHLITSTGIDVRNNSNGRWRQCLTNFYGNPGFMITKSTVNQPWAAFPNTFAGCEISVCSPDSGMPVRVRQIRSLTSTWQFWVPRRWKGNAAYDIWFDPKPRTSGEDTGAEVMVWLDTNGLWRAPGPIVKIDGTYWVEARWTAQAGTRRWHYIRFWRLHQKEAVRNLNLLPFFRYAERVHNVAPAWWLTSVEAGYELWSGGLRIHTFQFAVHLKAKSPRRT